MIETFDQQAEVQELSKIKEPYHRFQARSPLESCPIVKLHKYGETGLGRAKGPSRLWSPLPSADTATGDRLIYLPLGNGSCSAGKAASGTNEALYDPFSANFQTAATAGRQTCPSHGHSGNGG
jgi:hypothetical protein